MASNERSKFVHSTKGRTRYRLQGMDSEFDPDDMSGYDVRRRSGGSSKESGGSPRNSVRKKRAEMRLNQRDAKTVDRNGLLQTEEDDIFERNMVIGSQPPKGSNNVLLFGSSKPFRCLSTSCLSEKDLLGELDKSEKTGQRRQKRKSKPNYQKTSLSDKARSRYVNRLKQVITAGNNRQNQAEKDRKVDPRHQKYKLLSTELIWLELQAWFSDRTLNEQDLILFNARQTLVSKILSFVTVFRFNPKYVALIEKLEAHTDCVLRVGPCDDFIPTEISEGLTFDNIHLQHSANSSLCVEKVVSPAKSNLFIMLPSDEYLLSQKHALKTVGEVLRLLCVIESLYPSSSLLGAEHPQYKDRELKAKVESLCCWYNVTTDLRYKFASFVSLLTATDSVSEDADEETDDDTAERINHGDHVDISLNMNDIDVDHHICAHTERTLKQKPVKGILEAFIKRLFASLFRAKMNLLPESCYESLYSQDFQRQSTCRQCTDSRENSIATRHCYICLYRLKDSVRTAEEQKLQYLMFEIEKVLTLTESVFSMDALDVIMENSTAVGVPDSNSALFDLPCLRPIYLSFPSTLFALMRQCMHLRMKQTMPFFCNNNNSGVELLTAKQLVLESKEMLECALLARSITRFFYDDVAQGEHNVNMMSAFSAYEADLHCVVATYLDFVDTWLVRMQKDLPHVPRSFHEILEKEWKFCCQIMSQIGIDTLLLSSKRFIKISADIVSSTSEFLKTAIKELVQPLSDITNGLKDFVNPTGPVEDYNSATSSTYSSQTSSHKGKAGVLWYQHQRSESPHLLRHDSSQSADSTLDSPIDFDRQISNASSSSNTSFHWHRSTSQLGHQKRYLFEVCRAVRDLFNETRERGLKILHFGKRLRKTLEPAIGYQITEPATQNVPYLHCCQYCQIIDTLQSEGFILIDTAELCMKMSMNESANCHEENHLNLSKYWMFIPNLNSIYDEDVNNVWSMIQTTLLDHIKKAYLEEENGGIALTNVVLVRKPLETHGARRQSEIVVSTRRKSRGKNKKNAGQSSFGQYNKTQSENNLLEHLSEASQRCSMWYGKTITISDHKNVIESMKLISEHFDIVHDVTVISASADDVGVVRKEFNIMLQSITKVSVAQMPIVRGVKPAFNDLRERILDFCQSLIECIDFILGHLESQMDKLTQQHSSRSNSIDGDTRRQIKSEINEVMQSCFNFCFDFVKEATRLMSGEFRSKITKLHMAVAKQWIDYVLKHRSKGRMQRPRWATQGLNFLVSIDMSYWYSMQDEDYNRTKEKIDSFLHHLIGDASENAERTCEKPHSKSFSTLHLPEYNQPMLRSLSNPSATDTGPHSPVSLSEDTDEMDARNDYYLPIDRIRNAVQDMEIVNNDKKREAGVIGRVSDKKQQLPIVNLGVRTVNFRWQRGARVGEGAFGQVYTCVNVDTGTVLAMKEVKFHPNDHKKIRAAIDEYTNFEGIRHPNLVHYYGVELHRDEMYIFMEYCDNGTLGDICKISLPEIMVRRYASQILSAVHVLHSRGIVHRDIKGSNIFLSSAGTIKLGDFGSAVKLKNVAKTTPGEMVSHIGTTLPYAAPEVVNANESIGYGRASDVWSVGCVVIEMSTGKQPWQGLEIVQVMFKVGSGEAPAIPDSLSEEGKDFVRMCTIPNATKRWTTEKLLGHAFVKILDSDGAM